MSNAGGKRPGCGRPKGAKNKATLEREALARDLIIRQQAAGTDSLVPPSAEDIAKMSPVDVMRIPVIMNGQSVRW